MGHVEKKQEVNTETIAAIRNKLQAPKTALELLKQGRELPKEFIDNVFKDLEEVAEALKEK